MMPDRTGIHYVKTPIQYPIIKYSLLRQAVNRLFGKCNIYLIYNTIYVLLFQRLIEPGR